MKQKHYKHYKQYKQLFALVATLAFTGSGHAQDTDPYLKDSKKANQGEKIKQIQETQPDQADLSDEFVMFQIIQEYPKNLLITYEVFSVPLAEAAKLSRGGFDSKELYNLLTTEPQKHDATLEILASQTIRSGQLSKSESISELIYPKEYEPVESPEKKSPEAQDDPKAESVLLKSFATRNAGFTLVSEPTIGDGPKIIPLTKRGSQILMADPARRQPSKDPDPFAESTKEDDALFSEYYTLRTQAVKDGDLKENWIIDLRMTMNAEQVGETTWSNGPSTVTVPKFDTQNTETSLTCISGEPYFMGTFNPHPLSSKHKDGKKVWFAFVTAKIIQPGL